MQHTPVPSVCSLLLKSGVNHQFTTRSPRYNRLLANSYNVSVGTDIRKSKSYVQCFQSLVCISRGWPAGSLWRKVLRWLCIRSLKKPHFSILVIGSIPHCRSCNYSEPFPVIFSFPNQQEPVSDPSLTPNMPKWCKRPYLSSPLSRWPTRGFRGFQHPIRQLFSPPPHRVKIIFKKTPLPINSTVPPTSWKNVCAI